MEDYICYDGKVEISKEVKEMSKEQKEKEFQRLFGKYIIKDDKNDKR